MIQSERAISPAGFLDFCRAYPDVPAELLPDGSIELTSPQTLASNESEFLVGTTLGNWYLSNGRIGKAYGANAGFTLPDGSVRSPDCAWVSPERLAGLSAADYDSFARLVPDFVVEVLSTSDSLKKGRRKMSKTWMANGVRLAWLIAPSRQLALVYRASDTPAASAKTKPEELRGFESRILRGEDVVEGFELPLRLLL